MPRRPADGTGLASLRAEIQANLHRPFTVAGLAATAHISPRTFARRFVAATATPTGYRRMFGHLEGGIRVQ